MRAISLQDSLVNFTKRGLHFKISFNDLTSILARFIAFIRFLR